MEDKNVSQCGEEITFTVTLKKRTPLNMFPFKAQLIKAQRELAFGKTIKKFFHHFK